MRLPVNQAITLCTLKPDAGLCMRLDLPLDKKTVEIRTGSPGLQGHRGPRAAGPWRAVAGRGLRAAGPLGRNLRSGFFFFLERREKKYA